MKSTHKPTLQERIDRIGELVAANPPAEQDWRPTARQVPKKQTTGPRELQARRDREDKLAEQIHLSEPYK